MAGAALLVRAMGARGGAREAIDGGRLLLQPLSTDAVGAHRSHHDVLRAAEQQDVGVGGARVGLLGEGVDFGEDRPVAPQIVDRDVADRVRPARRPREADRLDVVVERLEGVGGVLDGGDLGVREGRGAPRV